ncbi:MAG: tRNA pseudouridine(55) synthase TruB [Lachnospiraceae bacterium]|nr:tRNA pseudouridine(55) synthase TruB [Lachnospiraceae bacterium]
MHDGILNVYKEAGYTSFDVVTKLRGILHQKKIGHTGTLDPLAEGVLVVCLGKATKLCDILPDHDKVYEATMLLGTVTDTEDTSGKVLHTSPVEAADYPDSRLEEAVYKYQGTYDQIPPMYSAIKVDGRKLYELAREGQTIERKARPVTIYSLEILRIELPRVTFRIACSRGTYIRSLCRDIGEDLGCGACMEKLVRVRACGFDVGDSLKLDAVANLEQEDKLKNYIVPIDSMYQDYPKLYVRESADRLVYNGNKLKKENIGRIIEGMLPEYNLSRVPSEERDTEARFLVYDSKGVFVGIYEYRLAEGLFVPYKMFL